MDRWDAICEGPQKHGSDTPDAPDGFYHAWYSAQAHESLLAPSPAYYLDASGKKVAVSEVSKKPSPTSKWPDLTYLGLVGDKCVEFSHDILDELLGQGGDYEEQA